MDVTREILKVARELTAARLSLPPFTEGGSRKRIDKWLPILEQAIQDKHIWNVDFKDLKSGISRAYDMSRDVIEKEGRKVSDEPTQEEWKNMTVDERKESYSVWRPHSEMPFELRGLKKFLRNLGKYDGPMKREFKQWAESWLDYQDAILSLKPFIEKGRKVDPNAPVKERYEAPRTSTGGTQMIKAALDKVVSAQANRLKDTFVKSYMKQVETFLAKREETDSPYQFFKQDPEARDIVERMMEETSGNNTFRGPKVYELRSNASSIADKMAAAVVKDIVERYLYKNTNKIGSVVERKGGLKSVKVVHGRLQGWGFSGEFICSFSDDTAFTVRNKAVYHYNYRGKDYMQFPTTFHSVSWPDGKTSRMLSEKQMNEEWAKA